MPTSGCDMFSGTPLITIVNKADYCVLLNLQQISSELSSSGCSPLLTPRRICPGAAHTERRSVLYRPGLSG